MHAVCFCQAFSLTRYVNVHANESANVTSLRELSGRQDDKTPCGAAGGHPVEKLQVRSVANEVLMTRARNNAWE